MSKPLPIEEVYESLCVYDQRSPYYLLDWDGERTPPRQDSCACDLCYSGRDKLAMEILRLRGEG